jgi:hypothetical protein
MLSAGREREQIIRIIKITDVFAKLGNYRLCNLFVGQHFQ